MISYKEVYNFSFKNMEHYTNLTMNTRIIRKFGVNVALKTRVTAQWKPSMYT